VESFNEDVRCREEDGEGGYDGEHGEETEAEPVDDHRRELPVTALDLEALVLTQFRRDGAQLSEDALQQADGRRAPAADARKAVRRVRRRLAAVDERRLRAEATRRAMTTAGARPAGGVGARRVVVEDAGAADASTAVKHPIIVFEVEHVGEQTLGRSLSQLYLAYSTTLLSRGPTSVVVDVTAWALHAQQPRQVLAHTFPHLHQ